LTLGRVPKLNETIETDILSMTVISIDGHRIRKVAARKKMPAPADSQNRVASSAGAGK